MTEETQQTDTGVPGETSINTSSLDVNKPKDNKKDKCRPMTKVVIRRLPPTMTQDQLLEQVAPLPEHDYMYFVKADMSLGQFAFSRAYINFIDQQDIFLFRDKFDNYVFIDAKGVEYPAVVEFAPFQRLPKKRVGKKKDPKCGTIETDLYYMSFLESRKNQEADSNNTQPKTEYSYQPLDNTLKKITSTPLLEYLKQRKQEKQRIRDEKREERKRRDMERRRIKEDTIVSKVLKNPDLDRELNKDNKENKQEDKERITGKDLKLRNRRDDKLRDKLPRDRDHKLLVKTYRDRVDDRNKDSKHQRRQNDKKTYGYKRDETRDYSKEGKEESKEGKKIEEKRGKSYEKMRQEKRKLIETRNQSVDGTREDNKDVVTEQMNETKEAERERERERSSSYNESKGGIQGTSALIRNRNDNEKSKSNEHVNQELKRYTKLVKRRSSLESGGGSDGGATGDGNHLRRHKSLDGGDQSKLQKFEIEDKDKDKKDPRLERRIRNKDRPAMEIYRPGMGKFSKQRLEREKSTNDERSSLSQSPTPSQGKSGGSKSASEVRTMTFKRSVSRDMS